MFPANKIRRLTEMDLTEIRYRLVQTLRVAQERIALARNGYQQGHADWRAFWNVSAANNLLSSQALNEDLEPLEMGLPNYLLSRRSPVFYCSAVEQQEIVRIYRELLPCHEKRILSEASRACEHRLKVFAYPEVACGPGIPWRKDIVHEIESRLDHRSQIRYLDFRKVGDSKIVWEPNRHQHLVILAMAYRLTGDNRYAEECFRQWEDWQLENPYLCGINWASSLESALRAWSWIWMIYLLAGSSAATEKRVGKLLYALAMHADFIHGNLSVYFSPNTHLLGEGFALFVIGLLFPEMHSSNVYRETGRRILMEEMTKQVRADGSHVEQSTCYHHYATDFFLCAAILADRNGCPFPSSYRARLERMIEVLLHTAWPDGTHPMIGDADGGKLLPMGTSDPNDHRGTLSIAAVYFNREDFRARAGKPLDETLWLLGPDGVTRFRQLTPTPPRETSKAFPDSGMVVMRNDWSAEANMMLFDAGPQGMGYCGHGHADALSVICSAQGTKWLVDPGTFVYTASRHGREFFRSTQAHNTLVIDGRGQAEPLDTFKWRRVCPARLERWTTLPHLDYACGSYQGYQWLSTQLSHRRSVVFIKPHRWFLLDEVIGRGEHTLEFFFHFSPDTDLQIEKNLCWAAKGLDRFLIMSDPRISFEKIMGSEQPMQGWYSQDYGHREPAPVLKGMTYCTTPAKFSWLLWPAPPDGVRLRPISSGPSAWVLETSTELEYFAVADGRPNRSCEFMTDADFAFLRQGQHGQVTRISLIGGTRVRLQGELVYESEGKVEEFDLNRLGNSLQVCMHPVKPFTAAIQSVASISVNGQEVEFRSVGDGIEVCKGSLARCAEFAAF